MDDTLKQFLGYDIQMLAPEWWDDHLHPDAGEARKACRRLLRDGAGSPDTHIAVVALDGDRMGRLLLGDPERVKVPWRDVLHPEAVNQIIDGDTTEDRHRWKMFWRTSLDRPRVLGPSTHAFITRALRHFSNRVLPWVVEREFGGRLIYAGGDDALVLCPAAEALPLLQRLDALFTAPWIRDAHPEARAWPEEEPDDSLYEVGSAEARGRFAILTANETVTEDGRIFPMLGEHQSFSAGVAFGPFKTSLRLLRKVAEDNRDKAKAASGRRAGLSWFTRNGAKLFWMAPLANGSTGNVEAIQALAKAFGSRALPSRLPYKLREMLPLARAIMNAPAISRERSDELLGRLVACALDGGRDDRIVLTWRSGLEAAAASEADPETSLGGLLLARALRFASETAEKRNTP